MNFSINMTYDNTLPYEARIDAIKDAGFTHAFLWWDQNDPDRFVQPEYMRRRGLVIETAHLQFAGINDMWLDNASGAALAEAPGNQLGFDVLRALTDGTKNQVFSPVSLAYALGMALEGADGATEDEINHLEKNIKAMPSVTTMLEEGKTVRDMLELALEGFQPDILDSYHVTYRCDCSEERVENMIRSLGKKEVEKLRDEDPIAEVNCQFCNKNYKVDLNELLKKWPASDEKQGLEKT